MKLSIIICVYNTGISYLEECLDSVFNSSLRDNADFEVVFVDDGSTVDYTELTEKYPVAYSKIENKGHLGARLYGLSVATGDYITFVDSDDTVSYNYHLPMLKKAEQCGADIVINDWCYRMPKMNRYCSRDTTISKDINCLGESNPLLLFSEQRGGEHSYFVFWNKIVKRSVYMQSKADVENVIGERRITYAEDALVNFFNFKHAKSVVNVHTGFYFYRIHAGQSVAVFSEKKLLSQIETMGFVLNVMRERIGENPHRALILDNLSAWRESIARYHYGQAHHLEYTSLYDKIKEHYGIDKLEMPYKTDGELYLYAEVLGNNFAEIDKALYSLYCEKKSATVNYKNNCKYIPRFIKSISEISGIEIKRRRKAEHIIPKNNTPVFKKIIFSSFVVKIGIYVIGRGSPLRRLIKKFLG